MKLLVYSSSKSILEQLQKIMKPFETENEMVVCSNFDSFMRYFRHPRSCSPVTVLSIRTETELDDILSVRNLLTDIRILLILPGNRPETLLKAHTLCPRFIAFHDAGYTDVKAVLDKMLTGKRTHLVMTGR